MCRICSIEFGNVAVHELANGDEKNHYYQNVCSSHNSIECDATPANN